MSDPAPNTSPLAGFNFKSQNATLPPTGSLVDSSSSHHSVSCTVATGVNVFFCILTNASPSLLSSSSVDVVGVQKVRVSISSS